MIAATVIAATVVSASARASGEVRVSVDWSHVSDATIARCKLTGLQVLLLQTLIESGYAVVDDASADGIAIVVSEAPGYFVVVGTTRTARRERHQRLPDRCDGTLGVELQAAVRAIADELCGTLPKPAPPLAPQPPPQPELAVPPPSVTQWPAAAPAEPAIDAASAEKYSPAYRLGVGAGVTGSSFSSLFIAPVVRLERRTRPVTLLAQVDAGLRHAHGVTAVEPVFSLGAVHELARSGNAAFALGAMAGVLGHVYSARGETGGHVDGRFALVAQGTIGPLSLVAMPTFRMRPVIFHAGDVTVYDIDRFGFFIAALVAFDV